MINEHKTYTVNCDCCGYEFSVYVEKKIPFVFTFKENIEKYLNEFGWYKVNDKIFCDRCAKRRLLNKE